MPVTRLGTLFDFVISLPNPLLGTPAGSKKIAVSPYRGYLVEAGFCVDSAATSGITLAMAIGDNQFSSAASSFTQVVTSTLGTFSSTNLFEGMAASVVPPSPAYLKMGDAIQWTTSGGQSSTVGGTLYALIRKG